MQLPREAYTVVAAEATKVLEAGEVETGTGTGAGT